MEDNTQVYIDILISLEPVFKKAGELAVKMRPTAASKNKFNTGVAGIDIVTEADLAVQEFILSEMAKTKLVDCQLIGEENTPSVKKFLPAQAGKGKNGLVLTLDPIDGTIIYAGTGRFFSTIVSLTDKKNVLYTFCHYPTVNWSRRIANNEVKDSGEFPKINIKEGLSLEKVIAYTHGNLQKKDASLYDRLIDQGYRFLTFPDITDESGACSLFFSGQVGGYYKEAPNPYDGTAVFHYAQTKKLKMYSDLDISTWETGDHGPHYQGWYLVLNK